MNKRGKKAFSVSLAAMMTLNMLPVGTIYAEETVTAEPPARAGDAGRVKEAGDRSDEAGD